MIIFINEDEAYLRWIDENTVGFVVNANRTPKPSYLVLHQSTCAYIATEQRGNWTTNSYIKICSNNVDELRDWAKLNVGGDLQPCGSCHRERALDERPAVKETMLDAKPQKQTTDFPELWRR